MARQIAREASRSLAEYRLLPRLTTPASTIDRVSLETPLVCADGPVRPVRLQVPLVSAAMQAVSGVQLGIELAKLGGAACIFCSQPIAEQARMVAQIKSHKAGFVRPETVAPEATIAEVDERGRAAGFSTFPVVDGEGRLLGLLTQRDYDPRRHGGLAVTERMVPRAELEVGVEVTSLETANRLLLESHQSVLPIVDGAGRLRHLVFKKDIYDHLENPLQVVDGQKRLVSLAAVNTHDYEERVPALVEAGVDALCIDASDGHSFFQERALRWIDERHPALPVVGGNVVTGDGFRFLVDAGARAVKVGMGGGSICITQEQKGTGRGLATALADVVAARDRYREESGRHVPVVADGGIRNAMETVIALAIGADYVMLGRYFARMEESPTDKVVIGGRVLKPYWGEGSARARDWKQARYHQLKFEEGVEGFVEYAGRLRDNLDATLSKIKASLSSCGVSGIRALHAEALLEPVSAMAYREGQAHSLTRLSREGEGPGEDR